MKHPLHKYIVRKAEEYENVCETGLQQMMVGQNNNTNNEEIGQDDQMFHNMKCRLKYVVSNNVWTKIDNRTINIAVALKLC